MMPEARGSHKERMELESLPEKRGGGGVSRKKSLSVLELGLTETQRLK